MDYLVKIMLDILQFFYMVGGHNYGLAIIWLTVAVNLALYPLTLSSMQQMGAMQKIQPKMKEIQEKYKSDPQKMQKEIMQMYKSEGVNPLGGCLPVLLKIPFFLALFFALQSKEFTELISAPGVSTKFLWLPGLSIADPTRAMPILIGITTWLMQKTLPVAGEQAQMMNWIMPVFITFVSIPFPSGVQLYWVVSNVIGAAQQYYIIWGASKKEKRRKKNEKN